MRFLVLLVLLALFSWAAVVALSTLAGRAGS